MATQNKFLRGGFRRASAAALLMAASLGAARGEEHPGMDHSKMDHSGAAPAAQWADPGKAQVAQTAPAAEAPKTDEHTGHHGGGMMGGMGGMDHSGSGGGMSHGGGMMQQMMCGFTEHLDGRLAYLKAELRLTDTQTGAWNGFADAWRAAAQKANAKCAVAEDHPDHARPAVLQKLDKMETHMADHLGIVRAQKAAIEPLFTALSEEQRKIASEAMSSIMKVGMSMMGGTGDGMSGMMGGMGGMGGMNHGGSGGGMGGMQH